MPLAIKEDNSERIEQSENLSESLDREDEETIFQPSQVLRGKNFSRCWNQLYFKGTLRNGPDKTKVYCKLCSNNPKAPKYLHYSGSTTNLLSHHESHHKAEWNELHGITEDGNSLFLPMRTENSDSLAHESMKRNGWNKENKSHRNIVKLTLLDDFKLGEGEVMFEPEVVLNSPSSACWKFFYFKGTEEGGPQKAKVFCRLCSSAAKINKTGHKLGLKYGISFSGGTTNLNKHLEAHHPAEWQEEYLDYLSTEKQSAVLKEQSFKEKHSVNQKDEHDIADPLNEQTTTSLQELQQNLFETKGNLADMLNSMVTRLKDGSYKESYFNIDDTIEHKWIKQEVTSFTFILFFNYI